ncbi:MAG TPA: LysR family transcriptional regulator [Euryarchaeota archaeon]|nr:LysR family transcriptional regulator [Euryarchaeota archaeon]
MDLKSLRYFLAIADEGSISAAAESLNLSQPNISRQMTLLEKELGAKLFERGSRRIVLTEEGMLLRRRAVEILQLADTAVTEIGSAGKDVIGTVRIGCGETDAMRVVARAIRRFSETHPMVRFELHSGNAEDVSDLLERGLVDFGVLIEPTDKTRYDYLSFPTDIRWGALVRRDDPLARLHGVSPSDISGRRVIVSRQNMAANGISGWMGPDFPEPDVVATYNLLFNASLLVSEGVGIALCLEGIVNTSGDSDLVFVPFEPELRVGMSLVWKKNSVQGRAQRLFLDGLREFFGT